jgi:hypothetical protein
MIRRHWHHITLGLVLVTLVVLFFSKSYLLAPNVGEALAAPVGLDLRAVPVPLNSEDPAQRMVGALHYVGGWPLTADQKRFGGFSGLTVRADGRLTAINDLGAWLTAKIDLAAIGRGTLRFEGASLQPYTGRHGENDKKAYDAEALLPYGDAFLVSFEQKHRIRITAPGQSDAPWPPARFINFGAMARNSGLEAMTWVSDGVLLAFEERGLDTAGRLGGWLVTEEGAERLYLKPPENFAPTDAVTLPGGDVLLVMRRYSVRDGVSAKVLRLEASSLKPGAVEKGAELAHLEPPLAVDNLEALDAVPLPGGGVRLFILSDDNFNASQRTLLLVFDLLE